MEIKPIFDRIIAKCNKNSLVTKSGIQLAEEGDIKSATICEISQGAQNTPLQVGYTIYYEEHTVANFKLEDEDYILIKLEDILAYKKGEN